MVETPRWDVTTVMVRGSLPAGVFCTTLLMIPGLLASGALPFLALFLTATHGSFLVRHRVRRY
ncbi:hypothetical protein [Streptomyces sp. NPDC059651]|uniref:hypothetical protein n=1 Tax=Streptomyces sp. NPDC059651 TaxID=3346897 RepID=UPI0036A342AB